MMTSADLCLLSTLPPGLYRARHSKGKYVEIYFRPTPGSNFNFIKLYINPDIWHSIWQELFDLWSDCIKLCLHIASCVCVAVISCCIVNKYSFHLHTRKNFMNTFKWSCWLDPFSCLKFLKMVSFHNQT